MIRRFLVAVLALLPLHAYAATGTHAPNVAVQYFNNSGEVCNGCLLFTYSPGTTTKKATYSEVSLTTANANPIVLDSAGRATIFLTPGESYKFVLAPSTDTDPPTSAIWTRDNISAIAPAGSATDNDVAGTAGENLAAGDALYLSDGTGGTTAGRWYKADADNSYSSSLARQVGFAVTAIDTGSSGTIRLSGRVTSLAGLVAGTVYYASATAGSLTSTAPTNARALAVADSSTTAIVGPAVSVNEASSSLGGIVSAQAQTFEGLKTLADGIGFASTNAITNLIYARSSSNFTKNNNTTLADVTGLSFAVEADSTYLFVFFLHGKSASAADYKFQLTGPAAPTAVRYGMKADGALSTASAAAFSTPIQAAGVSGVDEGLMLWGLLRNGANAGTVQLQAAQLANDASDTVIYAESSVIALKIQ